MTICAPYNSSNYGIWMHWRLCLWDCASNQLLMQHDLNARFQAAQAVPIQLVLGNRNKLGSLWSGSIRPLVQHSKLETSWTAVFLSHDQASALYSEGAGEQAISASIYYTQLTTRINSRTNTIYNSEAQKSKLPQNFQHPKLSLETTANPPVQRSIVKQDHLKGWI